MNVLFFADRISYGGGEKVRNWLAANLASSGFSVFYAISDSNELANPLFKSAGILENIHLIQFDRVIKFKHPLKYANQIARIYKEYQIDLLIYFGASLIEQIVALSCGVKVLLSERFYNGFRPLKSRVLKQIQYRFATGYVFQTPEASLIYGKRAHKLGVVIPNPIIDELPQPVFDNLRNEIVNVGRLCRQKDQKTLLSAFAIFSRKYPDYKLIIYGSGEEKDNLIRLAQKLGIENKFTIVSGAKDIVNRINGAKLFVLSSLAEGMPNALIEAMTVGVLSISTDCPAYGSRMLVKDGVNGFLVPVGDVSALGSKMMDAIENSEKYNIVRQHAVDIRETLREDKIFKLWQGYINSLLS